MKTRLLLLIAMLLPSYALANDVTALIIKNKDGKQTGFLLTEFPKLSFTDSNLSVNCKDLQSSFLIEAIESVAYLSKEDLDEAGIEAVYDDGIYIISDENGIQIGNCSGKDISVFDLSGLLIKRTRPVENIFPLNSLSGVTSGYYIVECESKTFKVHIR